MLGMQDVWIFVLSGLLLNMTPGPDTAYIVGRSLQRGWSGGASAAMGISAGCLVHVVAASIGLSALLAASSVAFTLIKIIGAIYLCYAGVRMILAAGKLHVPQESGVQAPTELSKIFWQGALTNILNPKIALFFLALLPQFVASDAPSKPMAFAALGLIFVVNGTIWNLGVAALASGAARRVQRSRSLQTWISRSIGVIFIYIGVRVALLEQR